MADEEQPRTKRQSLFYRGSFACVGNDGQIHTVEARIDRRCSLMLYLDDGRRVLRIGRGRYQTAEPPPLSLICDHPDAP